MNLTYDVRVYGIRSYKGKNRTTYTIRWVVGGKSFQDTFATKALAESERSALVVAQRQGIAFDVTSGLPEPKVRKLNDRSWLELAMDFVSEKWGEWSPKHRRNTADALTGITLSLLETQRGAPSERAMRAALNGWAFNASRRRAVGGGTAPSVPDDFREAMEWLGGHCRRTSELDDSALLRKVLNASMLRQDGNPAAASTARRKRAALSGVLKYAVQLRLIQSNPLPRVGRTIPKIDDGVDRRTVPNGEQALALLAAVREIMPDLEAWFGCIYYSALRPEEVNHLKDDEFQRPKEEGGWGWFSLTGATVEVSDAWGEHTGPTEDRELKHRARRSVRRVPVPPALVKLILNHIEKYGVGPDGRIFISRRGPGGRFLASAGHPVTSSTVSRVWQAARKEALTPTQIAAGLARVPYHLRHACVSLWLNAGVPPTQVAEWAGHSVRVLLSVYAACLDGQEESALRRIQGVLDPPSVAEEGKETSPRIPHNE
jgi:integrase